MKLLHVIPSIAEKDGGPSQAIFPMCASLIEQGIDVLLATTDAGLPKDVGLQRERVIAHKGVPVIVFPSQAGESFKYSRQFPAWLDQNVNNFDVVHIHAVFNHSCMAAARACRKHGVPYVVRPLGTLDPWSMKQKGLRKKVFWRLGAKRMLESAAAVHYTSSGEQEAVETSLGLQHGFVAPLGVESGVSAKQSGENPYVLVMSRLHPKKELETLIESFLVAVKKPGLSKWRLVIAGVGEPEYVARLKRLAAGDSSVVFTGWVEGKEKETVLSNAAVVALISRQENFGLCIAEAMARGVPVLVSPQVNLSVDIENSASGWVVPIDKDQIAGTLAEIMTNESERKVRGSAGRDLAAQRFSWDVIGQRLASVYASIMDQETRTGIPVDLLKTIHEEHEIHETHEIR